MLKVLLLKDLTSILVNLASFNANTPGLLLTREQYSKQLYHKQLIGSNPKRSETTDNIFLVVKD
jgi:hypothetical protein